MFLAGNLVPQWPSSKRIYRFQITISRRPMFSCYPGGLLGRCWRV